MKSLRLAGALAAILVLAPSCHDAADLPIREPAVSGRFYPAEPDRLEGAIRAYLDDAREPGTRRPIALVAPHAGIIFSGQIAADAFRQAMGHDYDLVVILGTNHTSAGFRGVSFFRGRGYRTPLGLAKIDLELTEALIAADSDFVFNPSVHAREHSVEVQVPFVQVAFPEARIVAAVVGQPDLDLCRRLGKTLSSAVGKRRALIVASSDLSHYPGHDDAVAADRAVLTAAASLDSERLQRTLRQELARGRSGFSTGACGEAPVLAAMEAARALGADRGTVISYANSGNVALGERSRVVGYGALVFSQGGSGDPLAGLQELPVAPREAKFLNSDRRDLLRLARETLRRFVDTNTTPLARGLSPVTRRLQGAFVTLKKDGQLRGCIGHMAEDTPLAEVVSSMAMKAAFEDRRFPPLKPGELDEVEIEVSVLTPMEPVSGPEEIVVGRDGVVLRKSGRSAVFLPQVATEQGWNRNEMLDHLARKARLPAGAWRKGAEFLTFQAIVFSEGEGHE